jgi:hypothetical protein
MNAHLEYIGKRYKLPLNKNISCAGGNIGEVVGYDEHGTLRRWDTLLLEMDHLGPNQIPTRVTRSDWPFMKEIDL